MDTNQQITESLTQELKLLWCAHERVGLTGKMCLYALDGEDPFRVEEPHRGTRYWFGPNEIQAAVDYCIAIYNEGNRPNSTLLLNPIVHEIKEDGTTTPLGSGFAWASALGLGVATLTEDQYDRPESEGAAWAAFARGDKDVAGIKCIAFSDSALKPQNNNTVEGCEALYDLTGIDSAEYAPYYMLSGLAYLTKHGAYEQKELSAFGDTISDADAFIAAHTVDTQSLINAQTCFNAYGRHPSLYIKFGNDIDNLERNLEFYQLCARDFELFDATGPMKDVHGGSGEFEFVVEGLIPRGSITLLSATGGTGKSSVAHLLCVLAATNWREDEQPMWLGQPINKEHCKGICVYFTGEDGPAIINARQKLYDPEGRAQRIMFQRTDFRDDQGGEINFPQFMKRLHAMPDVPVMVIDPARKYLTGDEDDAGVVSEFFEAIEEFAIQRNCAVIVVHHLAKGAKPQSAAEVVDELRGSQVFIDRPRIVIGMFREGPHTIVGLGKCNIPPHLGMVTHERVFRRDPKNLMLVQLEGEAGIRGEFMSPEEIEALKEMGQI